MLWRTHRRSCAALLIKALKSVVPPAADSTIALSMVYMKGDTMSEAAAAAPTSTEAATSSGAAVLLRCATSSIGAAAVIGAAALLQPSCVRCAH